MRDMFEMRPRKGLMNFNLNVAFVSLLASVLVRDDLFMIVFNYLLVILIPGRNSFKGGRL